MRVSKPGEHPADVAKLAVGLASQHPGQRLSLRRDALRLAERFADQPPGP
jgi:hypothetical protein